MEEDRAFAIHYGLTAGWSAEVLDRLVSAAAASPNPGAEAAASEHYDQVGNGGGLCAQNELAQTFHQQYYEDAATELGYIIWEMWLHIPYTSNNVRMLQDSQIAL